MCVFGPSAFFSLPGRESFPVLSAPWHAGSPAGPRTQVWALAEVRGTCSGGSKWKVRWERDSEHVEPSRPMQTHVRVKECPTAHVQVKRMSDGSHVIYGILNVVNVGRHYLVMETLN